MTDFDPGDGWRKVSDTEAIGKRRVFELDENGEIKCVWVREEPVPPLPTEPYTVIRVMWVNGGDAVLTRIPDDEYEWHGHDNRDNQDNAWYDSNLHEAITGFEVLAEPLTSLDRHRAESVASVRRETAKAIIKEVRNVFGYDASEPSDLLEEVAREFGVDS